jgi:hypothetical protein
LKSDAATESDGIYIDDIEILTGQYMISDVERISALVPKEFSLSQNYPNPFNPTTRISFNVPITSEVTLTVFDVVGREIASLASGIYQPGKYEATFDASPLSSGFYFAKLTAGTFTSVRKMLLIK